MACAIHAALVMHRFSGSQLRRIPGSGDLPFHLFRHDLECVCAWTSAWSNMNLILLQVKRGGAVCRKVRRFPANPEDENLFESRQQELLEEGCSFLGHLRLR